MRNHIKAQDKLNSQKMSVRTRRIILSVFGVFLNAFFSYFTYKFGLPLFFDTLGTVFVASISGLLFPSICTALAGSLVCSFYYWPAIYLSFFNILVAIITVVFIRKNFLKKITLILAYLVIVTFISSVSVSFLQYFLYGQNDTSLMAKNAIAFSAATPLSYLLSLCITNFLLYYLQYGLICITVKLILLFIPQSYLTSFEEDTWSHRLISKTAQQYVNDNHADLKNPLHKKVALTFIITSMTLVFMTEAIALKIYFDNTKEQKTQNAWNCVKLAVDFINPDKVDDYIKFGTDIPEYNKTLNELRKVQKSFPDVTYLYALRIEENGGRFIFDTDEDEPYLAGHLVPYDEEFEPHLAELFEGKEIEPVVSNNFFGWLLTVYYPVLNDEGKCVCYVGADVSMKYIAGYMMNFVEKVFFIMAGFFMVIISYTIWSIGKNMSYPISAIAACVDLFSDSSDDQKKLEENIKQIRSLGIKSGDEIQKLYDAICRMTLTQSEQIRDIRRLSESTLKMQDGLIITMADMVENRDSDTGAHVQKTSAYVKIIVEGLKKKGYYPQRITPKFMSDVVRSAPLHDVGKINISDSVLNKPGKLTEEEFEIMKTHTTAGKEILEKAISSVQGENYLKEARNMAAYHHERWDGKGYPEGLHGEVIPLSARIMAVADVFDALASPRVYKPAFPIEKALAILQEGSGTQFDPKCVEVFMDSLSEVKMILKKYNSGPAGSVN